MKYALVLLCLLIQFSCTNPAVIKAKEIPSHESVIMAYYVPERNFTPQEIPVEKLTHIIFSFTKVIDGQMKLQNPEAAGPKLAALVKQKERNPELKVMIACGGWGADGFSDMALTAESRARFIDSAREFIEEYQLDGMDMDWEYPGISGAGTMARPEDTKNFTALMKGLREMLDQFEEPKILTFASAGWKRYFDFVEMDEVMKYADYTNVMTYDQVSGVSVYTGHHTPLGNIRAEDMRGTPFGGHLDSLFRNGESQDPDAHSAEKIVNYLLDIGVDPGQIVIGAAFYGRAWKGVSPENNGLYQLSSGIHIGWSAYHHIRKVFEPDTSFVRYWDETAQAPYMYNSRDSIMISYDDTVSVALKTRYTMDKRLGGIMFWELGNDTKEEGSLLDAIYKAAME